MKFNNRHRAWLACFFLQFSLVFHASAQFKFYGTAALDESFGPTLTLNGHYFSTGLSNGQATITKVLANTTLTTVVWTKTYAAATGFRFEFTDIRESLSGNLIVIGIVRPNSGPNPPASIVVMEILHTTGAIFQAKTYPIGGNGLSAASLPKITTVGTDPDCASCVGAYILTFSRISPAPNTMVAMKLDHSLGVVWAKTYDLDTPIGNKHVIATDIIASTNAASNGGAVIAGWLSDHGTRGFLCEVDGCTGNVSQSKEYQSAPINFFYKMIRDFDGKIVVAGKSRQEGAVARLNGSTFAVMWAKEHRIPNKSVVFTGLTQLAKTNGDCFASYYAPNSAPGPSGGGLEPRVVKFKVTTGDSYYHRDLGGNFPGATPLETPLPLTANGTSKVVFSNGRVNGATSDGFLGVMPAAMNNCGTTTATLFHPLQYSTSIPDWFTEPITVTPVNICNAAPLTYLVTDACAISQKPGVPNPQIAEPEKTGAPTAAGFEIYPNPTSETIEVIFEKEVPAEGLVIEIFDLNGKLLKSEAVAGGSGGQWVDLADLPPGIYLLKAGEGPGVKLTKL